MSDFSAAACRGRKEKIDVPEYPDGIVDTIKAILAQHGCSIGPIRKTATGITFDVIGAPDVPLSPKAHAAAMNLAELGIICRTETDE